MLKYYIFNIIIHFITKNKIWEKNKPKNVTQKIDIFYHFFNFFLMGAQNSTAKIPTQKDFLELSSITNFSATEVEKLWKKFNQVSNSITKDNQISLDEFQHTLGLESRGFAERLFAAFDTDNSKEIDFREFVCGLSALSPRAQLKEKAKFCFNVYDVDKNGTIEKDELLEVLTLSLSENQGVSISKDQLSKIVNATYNKMDKNGDGKIDLPEFQLEAQINPSILACVNVNLDILLK